MVLLALQHKMLIQSYVLQDERSANSMSRKIDAFTIRFDMELEKDQEVTLSYRVQVGL